MQIVLCPTQKLEVNSLLKYFFNKPLKITISENAQHNIQKGFYYLNQKLSESEHPIYGINTGFGSLCNIKIDAKSMTQLQENLIQSHACGVGNELQQDIVPLILLLKIQNLVYGNSGVSLDTVNRLVELFNNEISPIIYRQGSLGASGDLSPLAHLSLPLIGKGEVRYKNERLKTEDVYKTLQWQKLALHPKEGLALLNGTQYMSGLGVYILLNAIPLFNIANITAALSLEAFNCRQEPFNHLIGQVRAHQGQLFVSKQINQILSGSHLFSSSENKAVQDPYSFRCIPQVHGASYDIIQFVKNIFETEINSVTDNPLIFSEENKILSGGNFHGQILSNALDTLCLALNQLGGISERRTYQLISGLRNLPSFLVKNPGINSGFMIPQYTAASIVNRNKILCSPASADSIVSSNGQEDYVSMGANAANKCLEILHNIEDILAIEFLTAAQALEFRRPKKSSEFIEEIISAYRKNIPFVEDDTEMHTLIKKSKSFLKENAIDWYYRFSN